MSSSNNKTGSALGNSRGESPSAKNGFIDSRSNYQITKQGGWKSMYHMMFHYNLDPTKDEDWQEAKRIVEGVRQGDMDQARAEASGRERGVENDGDGGGDDDDDVDEYCDDDDDDDDEEEEEDYDDEDYDDGGGDDGDCGSDDYEDY
ncbi:hypothetical protein PFICI_10161 [Pestalotiopsis fici W106-1]|uniref:Uncharacterized protein n=1 Tax=Pestalotiopsis fici (strain W106-1 / CGMCC3.15140) TaxID=1229662 RepID=W3WWB5_PESFW|nr:uncharacterized protein PFICI_10161 [Pestalotiopsis fici W106-1]ETS78099.1 hypothetical protein PFICI_10161 [Pestalotiopsis fici W106-1]